MRVPRVFVDAMHQSANITEGAHLNGLWRICSYSLALTAGSSVLLERRVSWSNYENSKSVSFNLGVSRFWIGAGATVLGNSASSNFHFARTTPQRVYTTGRQIEDELGLSAELVKP